MRNTIKFVKHQINEEIKPEMTEEEVRQTISLGQCHV